MKAIIGTFVGLTISATALARECSLSVIHSNGHTETKEIALATEQADQTKDIADFRVKFESYFGAPMEVTIQDLKTKSLVKAAAREKVETSISRGAQVLSKNGTITIPSRPVTTLSVNCKY